MEDLLKDLLPKKEKTFENEAINVRARKHFQELLKRCNFSSRFEFGITIVRTNTDELVGNFLVVGCELGEKITYIPKDVIKTDEPASYVALVLLDKEKVENVFLFEANEVLMAKKHCTYKNSPKKNLVGIKMKRYKSKAFQKRKFGVILNNFIKIGEN